MDFFDLSKKFERTYVGEGETNGRLEGNSYGFLEPIKERIKQGVDYAAEYACEIDSAYSGMEHDKKIKYEGNKTVNDLELTSVGVTGNLNEIRNEKIPDIYKNYYENKSKPISNLVIHQYKKKILSFIETNEVTILTGPTGCGKTTQVPQFILDSHIEKNEYCNIIVTQPRRLAAISISRRVCEEREWEIGSLCGYKVGLKNCSSDDTLLTYMTVGVFLQQLICKKNFGHYTHIILDEIHERDQTMDFALLVVKKLLQENNSNIKIILMSATVEATKFANYFKKIYLGKPVCAPVIGMDHSTNYAVRIHYLDELSSLGYIPAILKDQPCITEESLHVCVKLIKQFEKIDNSGDKKNAVLVFLPGLYEIEQLFSKLTDPKVYATETFHYKWLPLPLHSSITIEEQSKVFQTPEKGYRKIILSTNIAESSITVPGVKFVIDFCLTKVMTNHRENNYTCLQLCWASQANCIQRAGRVGRVMEGRVYRMVDKGFFEYLPKEPVPEMLTAPLEKVVLQSKMLEMGEPKAILATALDPPDLSNIEWTILILKEAGGLLPTRKGVLTPMDGDLTYLGRLMALLPVDIHITRLIVLGYLFSCLQECIIMGACMSLKSVFSHPFQARLQAYNSKLDWADGSCSDCIAFLNVYEVWLNNHMTGFFKRSAGDNEGNWAKRHFVQLRGLQEVKILVEELTLRLKENMIEECIGHGRVQWNEYQKALVLKIAIAGAFYPNYFGRGVQGGLVDEKIAVKTVGGRNPFHTVYLQNYDPQQPIELYAQLIKDELSDCKEDMKISTDGSSKVYLEFRKQDLKLENEDMPFDGTLPGNIPMAVYRAVKIRDIKKSIDINVLPLDEARKRAEALGIQRKIFSEEREEVDQQSIPFTLPGIDVSYISVVISNFINPGHFWAYDGSNSETMNIIFDSLNKSSDVLMMFEELPQVGDICIAPFELSGEKFYYRARIESLDKKGSRMVARVFFIDYGNSSAVDTRDLKKCTPRLSKIPGQAFECVLSGIRPSLILNPRGKWSEKAFAAFERIVQDGPLFGSIYSVVNGVVSLELIRVAEQNHHININKLLISEGYAEPVEENILSKANNEIRKQRQFDSDEKDAYNTLQRQNYWHVNFIKPPNQTDCTVKLHLRGPYSPLEMRIYPYTRGSLHNRVCIANDSVNSVLLDTDPQDSHERLIVASYIGQNASSSTVTLRNTTVMPNIHGLASIIAFIFAPEIELRVNREGTQYTGMLCGLGADEDGNSIFPEHDFEVFFDCEFTFEDFKTVNILRFFMSVLLITEDGDHFPNVGYPDKINFQRKIRKNLLSLLNKPRKSQEIVVPQQQFKWKLFTSDLVVHGSLATKFSQSSIFRFHSGVSIQTDN